MTAPSTPIAGAAKGTATRCGAAKDGEEVNTGAEARSSASGIPTLPRTLVLAWGNPGRLDDGLGPALAARLDSAPMEGVTVETDYQLQIEHAADLADSDRVIFVDADRTGPEPFSFRRLEPAGEALRYTSHEASPSAVLALCEEISGRSPEAWLLGIRGYDFDEFGEELSPRAWANLERADAFVRVALHRTRLDPSLNADHRAVPSDLEGER